MIKIKRASERGNTKIDWLNSYHSFSFGEYYDPENMGFGPLRVLNDDTVQPGAGFPTHPHRDMEIISVVTSGVMAHRDNTGGEGIIRPGIIQKMSAGKGILHSEFNASDKEILKLIQIWILPNKKGIKPSYEEMRFELEDKKNKLLLVASGDVNDGVIFINQNVLIYLSDLEKGKKQDYEIRKNRAVYLHLIEGKLEINGLHIFSGDSLQILDEPVLTINAEAESEFIVFDLAMDF